MCVLSQVANKNQTEQKPGQRGQGSHFVLLHISEDKRERLVCAKLAFLYLSHPVVI